MLFGAELQTLAVLLFDRSCHVLSWLQAACNKNNQTNYKWRTKLPRHCTHWPHLAATLCPDWCDMAASNVANVNVGVLGHVDAGKTSLVAALSTCLSTAALDKHPESKRRGMTVDLGFSSFTTDAPAQLAGARAPHCESMEGWQKTISALRSCWIRQSAVHSSGLPWPCILDAYSHRGLSDHRHGGELGVSQ